MRSFTPTAVVAGTGFGVRAHVPALRTAGYQVIGLVGRDPQKTRDAAASAAVERWFCELSDALSLRPQVVAICTPPHTHAELTRQAFAAGAHVVCEKPFTRTLDEARELRELAQEKGRIGLLCHEFRYLPSTALFARLLDDGVIGEPRMATLLAHGGLAADTNARRPAWWFKEELGGGWFGASGSHGVDRIRDWFGEVEAVSAQLFCAASRPLGSADDSFDLHFRTYSGLVGTFQSSAAAWGPPIAITKAVGTGGSIWIEDTANSGIIESVRGPVYFADSTQSRVIPVPDDLSLPTAALQGSWPTVVAPLAQLYRDLTSMIDGQTVTRRRPRPATFADGYENMRVMESVHRSSVRGGEWTKVL